MTSKLDVRNELVADLRSTLLGPRKGPEEVLDDFPNRVYTVGVLYPSSSRFLDEESDIESFEDDASEEDTGPGKRADLSEEQLPSSMGISFSLDKNTKTFGLDVRWAVYRSYLSAGGKETGRFQRNELVKRFEVTAEPTSKETDLRLYDKKEVDGLDFRVRVKSYGISDGSVKLTIFLFNAETVASAKGTNEYKRERCKKCIYSPKLTVLANNGIIARGNHASFSDPDLLSLELIYRRRLEFGTGHGCSVAWPDESGNRRSRLESEFLPSFSMPRVVTEVTGLRLPMGRMSYESKDECLARLEALVKMYSEWIGRTFTEEARASLEGSLSQAFDRHKEECEKVVERMGWGIEVLRKTSDAYDSFVFMNRAMFLQRHHYDYSRGKKEKQKEKFDKQDYDRSLDRYEWRPFQIAFILMNVDSFVNNESEERKVADLLWVPTGTGKTEAYLGLSVFAMAYRRKSQDDGWSHYGINVLMRYTLKLLTIQQFQRAAGLMCACEYLRTRDTTMGGEQKWGRNPFMVGLFVGENVTPNRIRCYSNGDRCAQEALSQFRNRGVRPDEGNPFQLTHCPWCGSELGPQCYALTISPPSLKVSCQREGCDFHKREIPALTVDEDIYHRLPSLLIATVDKFARLPFEPRVATLLGHVGGYVEGIGFFDRTKHSIDYAKRGARELGKTFIPMRAPLKPLELVIQDELHLITGPLGSMVGLYESAIDRLSELEGEGEAVLPKTVASTATIRGADSQVARLFTKGVRKFPPPGLDYSDSFFTKEDLDDRGRGKLYFGIFPSGIGQKTVMKRTMGVLLKDVQVMKDDGCPLESFDDFWTLVSYYNTIKELGSSKTTIDDDVVNLCRGTRNIRSVEELTSRVPSRKLPEVMEALERKASTGDAVDVVICSNMFSVGVDVQRLGLMIMNNQPKSTSEYLQSTGRVGRNGSGLVVVIYNWTRPRDQSHYERFYDYHNRIQIHVEASTITPFSEGARERSLHAQFIAIARANDAENLGDNSQANNFDASMRRSVWATDLRAYLIDRYNAVDGSDKEAFTTELDGFLDTWVKAAGSARLAYSKKRDNGARQSYLMRTADDDPRSDDGPMILTPNSMRNVERLIPLTKIRGLPP